MVAVPTCSDAEPPGGRTLKLEVHTPGECFANRRAGDVLLPRSVGVNPDFGLGDDARVRKVVIHLALGDNVRNFGR